MATRTLDRIQRLRAKQESAFASEESSSLNDFEDVRYISAEAVIEHENLDDEATTQRTYQRRKKIRGRTRVESLDIEVDFLPTGTKLDSGASPDASPSSGHGIMLEAVLGNYEAAAGTTEDGMSASTVSQIEATDASDFDEGGVMGVTVDGNVEVRDVIAKSGTTLTPRVEVSAEPDDGGELLNSYLWYLGDDPNKPLQFILEGEDRDRIHWLTGCALTGDLGFDINLASLVRMSFGLSGAKWLHDDDVSNALATAETSIEEATYSDTDIPLQFVDSEVIFAKTTGMSPSATRNVVPTTEISIEPSGVTYEPHETPGGTNGISRYQMVPGDPVATATFTAPMEADELRTYEQSWADEDWYTLTVQINNVAGKIAYISLPSVQITNVQPAAAGSYAGYTVTVEAHEDQDTSDMATEKKRSPLRIAVL